jgi:hypothetical protein
MECDLPGDGGFGKCSAKRALGEPCQSDVGCTTNDCENFVCVTADPTNCPAVGTHCFDENDCGSPVACNNKCIDNECQLNCNVKGAACSDAVGHGCCDVKLSCQGLQCETCVQSLGIQWGNATYNDAGCYPTNSFSNNCCNGGICAAASGVQVTLSDGGTMMVLFTDVCLPLVSGSCCTRTAQCLEGLLCLPSPDPGLPDAGDFSTCPGNSYLNQCCIPEDNLCWVSDAGTGPSNYCCSGDCTLIDAGG